ncbi:MAG: sigma-70 family RNA polymerase sigma factor [Planctomycetota bacterium]
MPVRRSLSPRTPAAPTPTLDAQDKQPDVTRPSWADPDVPAVRADDRVSPGGPTYFEKAVEEHGRRLLGIARGIVGYRASGEDVVQQALTNLYRHRERYDWRQPGPLLKRATVNEALRLLRPPKMTQIADDSAGRDARNNRERGTAPDEPIERNETVARVRDAIDELPEHFRAALVLCEYEGMSYQQISETLGCSIPQVKTWLHRARRKLADKLGPYVEGQRADG